MCRSCTDEYVQRNFRDKVTKITINHYRHYVARIPSTLFRHPYLSFIALGRFPNQHPVSHRADQYTFFAGRLTLVCHVDDISSEIWKLRTFDDICFRICDTLYKQNTEKRVNGYNLPFQKKGGLGITNSYRGLFLTAFADQSYPTW